MDWGFGHDDVFATVSGFGVALLEIHTCCIHYRPSIRMIQSVTSAGWKGTPRSGHCAGRMLIFDDDVDVYRLTRVVY